MKNKPKNRTGWIMLALVAASYILLGVTHPDRAIAALESSGKTLETIAPILIVVIFLIALMNTWIDPKSIGKYLGDESGIKGWLLALAGGVASHGSTLVWYPLLNDLRRHGARDGLLVAFLYARAIKVPWLPVMAHYFGWPFTLLLSMHIILGAWLQGIAADRLLKSVER
jgi:uncharacterized membrane protein YraQ (UPF0718 family)